MSGDGDFGRGRALIRRTLGILDMRPSTPSMMLLCHLTGDMRLTCPTANIGNTFNLPIYGGARRLIRDGYPLDTEVSFWRRDTPVIHKATIGHLARYTVQETDRHGLERRKRYELEEFQVTTGSSVTTGFTKYFRPDRPPPTILIRFRQRQRRAAVL